MIGVSKFAKLDDEVDKMLDGSEGCDEIEDLTCYDDDLVE